MGISDETEAAMIAIDEDMILEIKATIASSFQSSSTTLVVQGRQKNLPKTVLRVQSFQ